MPMVANVPTPVSDMTLLACAAKESIAKPGNAARPNVKVATVVWVPPPADPVERRGENSKGITIQRRLPDLHAVIGNDVEEVDWSYR